MSRRGCWRRQLAPTKRAERRWSEEELVGVEGLYTRLLRSHCCWSRNDKMTVRRTVESKEPRQLGGSPKRTTGKDSEMPLCLISRENKDVL